MNRCFVDDCLENKGVDDTLFCDLHRMGWIYNADNLKYGLKTSDIVVRNSVKKFLI